MSQEQKSSKQTSQGSLLARAGFRGKTLWDWLEFLILPVVVAAAGVWFSVQQNEQQRSLEDQLTQDAALQSYIDQMSELMLHENLNAFLTRTDLSKSSETLVAYSVAKTRTATVLARLDSDHNKSAIRFLTEGGLIGATGADPVSILWAINLQGVDFRGISLIRAGLANADFSGANLARANLSYSDLTDANLTDANLTDANLTGANLGDRIENLSADATTVGGDISLDSSGKVGAILTNANLTGANLTDADLTDANLEGVDLTSANLSRALGITGRQLEEQTASLEGATMPNGQKYEDWKENPRPITTRRYNPLPASGALRVGGYATEEFEPTFHFTVGEGWEILVPETADGLGIGHRLQEEYFNMFSPVYVYDPNNLRSRILAPENTDQLVSWLQKHPNLVTSRPVPVSVGGVPGVAIEVTDITVSETTEETLRSYCGVEQPCVPLLAMSATSGYRFTKASVGRKTRFVFVDVRGETVVFDINAPEDNFGEFLPEAQKVLDTVEWQE
jgi:uncharacterized protein YjbI with pentapeptide repeats